MSNLQVNETLRYEPDVGDTALIIRRLSERLNAVEEQLNQLRRVEMSPTSATDTATTVPLRDSTGAGMFTGVVFPGTRVANANANTQDYYIKGTWTPSFIATSVNPTVTYSARGGWYVWDGSMVWVTGYMQLSAASGGTGSLRIGSLPVTVPATEGYRGTIAIGYAANFTTLAPAGALPNVSTTAATLYGYGGTDAQGNRSTALTPANLSATTLIYFSGMYATG